MNLEVIFIGGSGRSGSTLLDRIIGQLPGMVSAGEIRDVWRAGVTENRLCGCGQPFLDCPLWSRVGQEAFGGWSNVDPVAGNRSFGSFGYRDVLRGADAHGTDPEAAMRADLIQRLYAGLAAASGGATIIDSSKQPTYGLLLDSVLPGSLRAIHLVRDSRGVAYSWAKRVRRPDTPGREIEMLRLPAARVAARWIALNIVMERLSRRTPSTRVRYETFLERPRDELRRLLAAVGRTVPDEQLDFVGGDGVRLQPNHTVMGNPMRMSIGTVPLRLDEDWIANLPAVDRFAVTAITWPMLLRYGYRP